MSTIRGVVKNGAIEWHEPLRLPMYEGMEVEILIPAPREVECDDDGDVPMTPEEIARHLANIDEIKGPWLEPEAQAAWDKARAEHKAWELAQWDERAKKMREMFP